MPRLGVNVDHVATLRQARRGRFPDPVEAARAAERAGCDSIVCHLREDRRHIQDRDLPALKRTLGIELNLEMGAHPEIVGIACRVRPDQATLVPERRQELTTEGGLDLARSGARVRRAVRRLQDAGIRVSLFIDPDPKQIERAVRMEVPMIELATGRYAEAATAAQRRVQLRKLRLATAEAHSAGLKVAAGHGLDYENVRPVARIPCVEELNIGFSIVARALDVGLYQAVREMVNLVRRGHRGGKGCA